MSDKLLRCQSNVILRKFKVNFSICVDINECALFPNICLHGSCENLERGYKCLCDPGYVNDRTGRECIGTRSMKYKNMEEYFLQEVAKL